MPVNTFPRLGNREAKVAIVEFADFECPFCRKHASTVFQLLKERYVDTGVAAYYYVHLPLGNIHPHAADAAKAGECASDQGRFWEMHDRLFASETTALVPELIRNVAASLKLDLGAFDTCLGTVSERITSDIAQAKRLDINATPAFMLGTVESDDMIALSTRINGAQQLEIFEKAIAALRQERR
jgi:protein-disulfide isomerase